MLRPPCWPTFAVARKNILGVGGNHRLEAFTIRLSRFHGTDEDMENLASMATNKPLHNWVDADVDRAAVDLVELAQKFLRVEAFARVKGRHSKRHAMAVVVGLNGRPTPIHGEFEIRDIERDEVDAIIAQVGKGARGCWKRAPQLDSCRIG